MNAGQHGAMGVWCSGECHMDETIFMSAMELADAIRRAEVSSVEAVTSCLERIEAVNTKLNAVVQLNAHSALSAAAEADRALARDGVHGPLHGVPMTIKDSLDTAGFVSTWGTPGRSGYRPRQDATVVARMRDAGAIVLGKTNTPELTLSFETDNPVYGRTNNPYDLGRTPGGSSGGAAAIVAAMGSPIDLGSDTGGSIRLPSHFCGIAGIKPTSGRVPRTGHAIDFGTVLDAFTQIGPMARCVGDLALVLPLISGVDGRDPAIAPVPLGDPKMVNLESLRGAFFVDNGIETPTPRTRETVKEAARSLSSAGVGIREERPAGIEESLDVYNGLFAATAGPSTRVRLERAGTSRDDTSLGRFLRIPKTDAETLSDVVDRWDAFRVNMLSFLSGYDFLLSPVNARPAVLHGGSNEARAGFSYTMTHNLTGWPAAVVRAGTSPEGLPIGVQIASHPWCEDVALAVAQHIETALGGWQPPSI